MLHATDTFYITECDECHTVTTCIELEEDGGGGWEVCENCYHKLDKRGIIAQED
jgi:hypothetical protein